MTEDEVGEIKISYTVRELLEGIKEAQTAGFASLERAIQGKADKGDIQRVDGVLDSHDQRLGKLEQDRRIRDERAAVHQEHAAIERQQAVARWSMRERILIVLTSCAIAGGTVAAVIH